METLSPTLDHAAPFPAVPSVSETQMRMVLEVSRLLAVPTELDLLLKRIADICCSLMNSELASIFLYDKNTGELWSKVVMGSAEIRFPAHKGIVGSSFTSNCYVHVPAPYEDPRFNPEPDRINGFVTRSLLACPMPDIDGNALGVIEAINKRGVFDENDFGLIHLLAEQAAVAIQRHNFQQEAMASLALRHEMNLARQVQQAMIPKSPPNVPGLRAAGWNLPASIAGGDCYDLWKTTDGRLGVLIADASGHGIGPALIVSQVRTLFRAFSDIECNPHCLLAHANTRLCEDLEVGQFVTAFLAFIWPDGRLDWSSAGHGPVFMRQYPDGPLLSLVPPSMPLGVDSEWSEEAPPTAHIDPGGSLFVVSDGIFEAPNAAGDRYEVDRLIELFEASRHLPPAELVDALRLAVAAWEGGREVADDQTIVVVQRDT